MIATERQIEEVLRQKLEQVKEPDDVAATLKRLHSTARGHRKALEDRLQSLRKTTDALSMKKTWTLQRCYASFTEFSARQLWATPSSTPWPIVLLIGTERATPVTW
jgi:hypothetical protein